MNYFTTDLYETKREIVNFSHYLSEGLSKADQKFVLVLSGIFSPPINRKLNYSNSFIVSWTQFNDFYILRKLSKGNFLKSIMTIIKLPKTMNFLGIN